jgi:hypothetical protein
MKLDSTRHKIGIEYISLSFIGLDAHITWAFARGVGGAKGVGGANDPLWEKSLKLTVKSRDF